MNPSPTHFNASAKSWDNPEKIARAQEYARIIKSKLLELAPDFEIHSVLELGCGTGLLGGNFLEDHTAYAGIDTSEEMLKVLKSKFPQPRVQTFNLELENGDLSGFKFNFLISQMAFHHLKDPGSLLKKLVLDRKSKFAIIDLVKEDGSFHPNPKAMGVHHFGFTRDEVATWATDAGLNLQHYQILDVVKKNEKTYPLFLAIFGHYI